MSKQKRSTKHGVATRKLAELQRELTAVEAMITAAEDAGDVDALVAAEARRDALNRLIARLSSEAAGEIEAAGAEAARAWVLAQADTLAPLVEQITDTQREVGEHIEAALAALKQEADLRQRVHRAALAADVLASRFELTEGAAIPRLPAVEDVITKLFTTTSRMRPSKQTRFVRPGVPASASPELRRRLLLRHLHAWIGRYRSMLPAEAVAILDAAPISDSVLADAPTQSGREQRQTKHNADVWADEAAHMPEARGLPSMRF